MRFLPSSFSTLRNLTMGDQHSIEHASSYQPYYQYPDKEFADLMQAGCYHVMDHRESDVKDARQSCKQAEVSSSQEHSRPYHRRGSYHRILHGSEQPLKAGNWSCGTSGSIDTENRDRREAATLKHNRHPRSSGNQPPVEKYVYPHASQHFRIPVTSAITNPPITFVAVIPFSATRNDVLAALTDAENGTPCEIIARMKDGRVGWLEDLRSLRGVQAILVRVVNVHVPYKYPGYHVEYGRGLKRASIREKDRRHFPVWLRFASGCG